MRLKRPASLSPCAWLVAALLTFVLLAPLACAPRPTAQSSDSSPSSPQAASAPGMTDDGQWTMAAKDYANTRYSTLNEINTGNVANLKVAWTFSTGLVSGHEGAPLVVGDTMYVVTPFPNYLYALDLTKPGAPMKWKYDPKPQPASQGVACCDLVNRGCAFYNGRIYYNTLDGFCVGVDAQTGKEIFKTQLGDINQGETITMAPIVAKGKVLVGNSGGEFGVRGWIAAVDADSGKISWKAYNTGPDADCLIGANFHPFYEMDRGKDLGVASWPPDQWKIGGGGTWGWISYDPQLNLIYHGTANPGPWNPEQRPGDNKWTSGVFARDPDTGEARWFYQWSPHDLHDYDGINENILVDLQINGQPHKVLLRPERNGYVYVLDRTTGEVLSATPYVYVNTSKGVDLKTGRLIYNDEKAPQVGKVVREICPFSPGAKDWEPSAFSLKTGWLYIPANNCCEDVESVEANYIAGTPYVGMNVKMYAGEGGNRGEFICWDPVAAKKVWSIKETFPVWSGVCVTAGDLAFYGTMDGWFKAVNAQSGEVVWQFKVGSGIIGQPITYRGPDGHQYVAVLSGVGGWAGAIVANQLDSRDQTAAKGFAAAMQDLPEYSTKGGMLYVFSLP
ncbi:MAG: methanol/ethanol family PQQ-dependent dehydrogenase [Blastocatellia bacterium]